MRLVRIVNLFAAAIFVVLAAISFAFLSAARDGFGGGGPWGAAGWATLFLLLALLAFVNLRTAASTRLLALNIAAALPLLVGLAGPDRVLCGAAAFPFAFSAGALAWQRRG